ncbi:MAG: hypothetical protein WBG38_11690 [Nodosilinea sp.]
MNPRSLPTIGLACLSLLLVLATSTLAQPPHGNSLATSEFRRIEQPLSTKALVTGAGLGLIGLELWWFLPHKPSSKKL